MDYLHWWQIPLGLFILSIVVMSRADHGQYGDWGAVIMVFALWALAIGTLIGHWL